MAVQDAAGRNYLPRTRKTRALLAVLAIASPRPLLRLQLASLLWSQRGKEQARASLRQSVHELQETLAPVWGHVFLTDRHHLSLRGPELEIDAQYLAQPGRISPDLLRRYENVLLEDMNGLDTAFDRWLEEERGRFLRVGRMIGESLIAEAADPLATIEAGEQLLKIDRRHEGAWRAIIKSHGERGDFEAALATYDRYRGTLAEASDARPSPGTEELISQIRAQGLAGHLREAPPPPPPPVVRPPSRRDRSVLRLRVMPLRVIGQELDDGLAVGLAEEISAGLSRFRWISCLPTSPAPSGGAEPFAEAGGVAEYDESTRPGAQADLILDGTIQRGLGRVRVIARLVDLRVGGQIVWAGRFDREMIDPLALQDELGAAIVAQVDPELMQNEARRSAAIGSNDLTAQELLLQALAAMYQLEHESFLNARRLLEMSLNIDPAMSVAHGWLAYWNLLYVGQGWAADPAASTAEAARLAERAVMLDPGDARALTLAGHVRGFLGKHPEEANALHERALALNPNLAIAWCFSGLAHCYMGQHVEALRRMQVSLRLSPSDPHGFFYDTALIMPHLMLGDYPNAVAAGRKAIEINPLFSSAYKGYLSSLGWLDRRREAEEILRRLLVLEPRFSVRQAIARSPLSRPEDVSRYAEGLRRAGLREDFSLLLSDNTGSSHSVIDLVPEAPQSSAFGA